MIEINNIYNMDCLEGLKQIPDNSIDLVVTDPPYRIISGGVTKTAKGNEPKGIFNRRDKREDWSDNARNGKLFNFNDIAFQEWLPDIFRVLKNKTHFYVMCNDRNMASMLNECERVGFKLVNILVWKKNNCTPNRYYMKNCEFILLFRKGNARTINMAGTKQCLEVNNIIGNKLHPTQKPIKLMKILIENSTNKNDIVLDPFMGVGSTMLAALKTDRQFIGFEIDENYYNIAAERIVNIDDIPDEEEPESEYSWLDELLEG